MGFVLVACGLTVTAIGGWRGFMLAREAVGPFVHDGEPTRTAVDSTRPLHARHRIRLSLRRVVGAVGWLVLALYGLFLAYAGSVVP